MNIENITKELLARGIESESVCVVKNGVKCMGIRVINPADQSISPVIYYSEQENLEEVIVHELFHLKMYPLDQTTESLITSCFPENSPAQDFAMTQFFTTLEQTVEELAKCFLLEFGENRELSFGRCKSKKSFNELFEGLKNLE